MIEYIKSEIESSIEVKKSILNDKFLLSGIQAVASHCIEALHHGNKILFAGNGGSAADAQHLAAELVGRYKTDRPGLPAIALTTDTSALTAIANDYGYPEIFKRQLETLGGPGDVFIGISTSGYSDNILFALMAAKDMNIISVGLTGSTSGAPIRESLCDYCLSVPSTDTARIQECHIMIGHIICGHIEKLMFPEPAA